jgi:hypothetical protein
MVKKTKQNIMVSAKYFWTKKNMWLLVMMLFITTAFAAPRFVKTGKVKKYSADVCIYGGTSAGVIAAYAAQRCSKTVILIEPGEMLGGMTTGGLGQTDIGNKKAITGLALQFYRKAGKEYGTAEKWVFEPHVALKIMQQYIRQGKIKVIFQNELAGIKKEGNKIKYMLLKHATGDNTRSLMILAKEYIDCSYEGDLMAMAGISYTVGREDNKKYHETLNGFQLADYHKKWGYHQFPNGISPYKIPGDPNSGLIWGVSSDAPNPAGTGDKKIQAYNFRVCLTDSAENRIPITRPKDYDSSKYELLVRLFAAQPNMRKINDYFIWSKLPNRKTDINNRGGFSTDMIGMNYGFPEGSIEERRKNFDAHISYTQGLLYFIKTDKRVPEPLRRFMADWGYPKDEYQKFGHFTVQLYIRESRRMIGEYVMTEHNCRGDEIVKDGIGMAAYTMDSHNCQRIVVNGMVKNEGNVEERGFPPYPISYRAITPKKNECSNLLVPVCLSASHIAYGSIRMEPVFMVLGQSAAIAAAMAITENVSVQNVNVEELQARLKTDPFLEQPNERK